MVAKDASSVKWWANQTRNFRKSHRSNSLSDGSTEPNQLISVEIWGKAAIGNK